VICNCRVIEGSSARESLCGLPLDQKKNTDFFFQGGEIKLVRTYTKDSQNILMIRNETLGVRFEMDSKGDIWSTSVQLLKSLDAIDQVITCNNKVRS
jgi:hypothetical protein